METMQMPKGPVCQCCSMPMTEEAHFGTEKGGAKSEDYCVYCYKEGEFTFDGTLEEMVDMLMNMEENKQFYTDKEEGRKKFTPYLKTLKRWK